MRVRRIDERNGLASLGYLIRNASSRGQGIATEELTSLRDYILSPGARPQASSGSGKYQPSILASSRKVGLLSRSCVFGTVL